VIEAIVNLSDLPLEQESHGTTFAVQTCEIGKVLGLYRLGAMLHVVPPGKAAYPYHRHHVSDEMFLILSGTGAYRIGERRIPVKAGDCLGAPAGGEAHQIINTGSETLRYIGFANSDHAEIVEYPDSGKIGMRAARTGSHHDNPTFKARGRLTTADYWDGE
jgi:uncharacterized cupin superfamily protein